MERAHFARLRKLVRAVKPILSTTFTSHNVKEGFRKAGIWPYSPQRIVAQIRGIRLWTPQKVKHLVCSIQKSNLVEWDIDHFSEAQLDSMGIPQREEEKPERKESGG